jgi:Domain of unknown function (DUF4440)
MPTTHGINGDSDDQVALAAAILEELLEIERSLWTNDAEGYYQLYSPNALLVFPGVGRIDRDRAVAAIRKENAEGRAWAEVTMDDVDGRWIVPDAVALVTYLAMARWNYESAASGYLCSTVYLRRQDTWQVSLHQQTPA